jgi:hypothetical protein
MAAVLSGLRSNQSVSSLLTPIDIPASWNLCLLVSAGAHTMTGIPDVETRVRGGTVCLRAGPRRISVMRVQRALVRWLDESGAGGHHAGSGSRVLKLPAQ